LYEPGRSCGGDHVAGAGVRGAERHGRVPQSRVALRLPAWRAALSDAAQEDWAGPLKTLSPSKVSPLLADPEAAMSAGARNEPAPAEMEVRQARPPVWRVPVRADSGRHGVGGRRVRASTRASRGDPALARIRSRAGGLAAARCAA